MVSKMKRKGAGVKNLASKNLLYKTENFALRRADGLFVRIEVFEALASDVKPKFSAVPGIIVKQAPVKFHGTGETLEAAMEDCLKKMEGVPIEEIIPDFSPERGLVKG